MKSMVLILLPVCFVIGQAYYELEPIVVTATRYPVNFMDISRDLTIIDSLQLKQYSDLNSVLTYIDGVVLKRRGAGIQNDISILGSSFQQVLVLVDGLRVNDPQTGHFNLNLPIELEAIDHIEVLHGAGSTLYGSDASAGVVNIITKAKGRNSLSAGLGSFGSNDYCLNLGRKRLLISLGHKDFDGHKPGYEFTIDRLGVKVNKKFSDLTDLMVWAGYLKSIFGARNFYAPFPSWEGNEVFIGNIQSTWYFSPQFGVKLNFFARTHIDTFVLDRTQPDFYANHHQNYTYGFNLNSDYNWVFLGNLHIGFEAFVDSINSSNLGVHRTRRVGIFMLADRQLWNGHCNIYTGLRFDRYLLWGGTFNPTFGITYRLNSHIKLRGSASSSFRAPSFTELYYEDPINKGDATLTPEISYYYDLGTDLYNQLYRGKITLFIRDSRKEIDWVRAAGQEIWQVMNIGRTRFYGINSGVSCFIKEPVKLSCFLSQVFVEHKLQENYFSKYILQNPRTVVTVMLDLFSSWWLRSNLQYYASVNRASYGLLNPIRSYIDIGYMSSYKFTDALGMNMSVAILNLFNGRYQDYRDVPLPGRSIQFSVSLSLN